jgi:hypothetical protein
MFSIVDSSTPIIAFGFAFFIPKANGSNIHRFLDAASATKDGRNLKLLFLRAFGKGPKTEYWEEGAGYDLGYREGIDDGCTQGFMAGRKDSTKDWDEFTSSRTEVSAQTVPTVNFCLDSPIDLESLDQLCPRAPAASPNSPLEAVWKRAFKSGSDPPLK